MELMKIRRKVLTAQMEQNRPVNLFGGSAMYDIFATGGIATMDATNHTATYNGAQANRIGELFNQFLPGQYTLIIKYTNLNGSAVAANMALEYADGTKLLIFAQNAAEQHGDIFKFLSSPTKQIEQLNCEWLTGTATVYCDKTGIFAGDINIADFVPYK